MREQLWEGDSDWFSTDVIDTRRNRRGRESREVPKEPAQLVGAPKGALLDSVNYN